MSEKATPAKSSTPPSTVQKYLDQAVGVLQRYGVLPKADTPLELTKLLEEVRHVDEPKVMTIAKTVQYMQSFNAMVRDNVEDVQIGNRYLEISEKFDSVRQDSKKLIAQLDDGVISWTEKLSNLWMRMRRGSPSARFQEIADIYKDVSRDTQEQLKKEMTIMDGYIDFRFALKEAEVVGSRVRSMHKFRFSTDAQEWARLRRSSRRSTTTPVKPTKAGRASWSLAASNATARCTRYEKEDRTYQLLKDIAENLSIGYDVGETLISKLKQTHDVKEQCVPALP